MKTIGEKYRDDRYYAKKVNSKGYLYDKKFSEKIPCAVEKSYELAKKLCNIYNNNNNKSLPGA